MNISLSPEILFYIGSFGVTNTLFWSIMLSVFLISFTLLIRLFIKEVPGRIQGFVEMLLENAYDFVRNVIGDDKKAKRIFPYIFTLFIFILTANLAVYIPGQSAVTLKVDGSGTVPLFRAIMSDYGMVFVMTMITIILTQIVAVIVHGPFGYLGQFLNFGGIKKFFALLFKGKFKVGVLAQGLLDVFLGFMDLVGEIAKIISLSFRLFGNIFAGEVLTAVMMFLAPFFIPLPFMFLGLLTAVVQAFVFSVLTLIFVSMASEVKDVEA
jgi:F-type H+-transporting ATPase subunit a